MKIDNAPETATFSSPAADAVIAADHPSPEAGGPCATCAFRPGTEANTTDHTITLATLCVEAIEPFSCHERPGLCRGWIAAVNLKHAVEGEPDEDERRHRWAAGECVEILSRAIEAGKAADERHAAKLAAKKGGA